MEGRQDRTDSALSMEIAGEPVPDDSGRTHIGEATPEPACAQFPGEATHRRYILYGDRLRSDRSVRVGRSYQAGGDVSGKNRIRQIPKIPLVDNSRRQLENNPQWRTKMGAHQRTPPPSQLAVV